MSQKFTVVGKPTNIREVTYEGNSLYAIDFFETASNNPPKGLPKASDIHTTALATTKQWNKLLKDIQEAGDTVATANKIMAQGEFLINSDSTISPNPFIIVSFQMQYVPKKRKGY